MDWKAAEYILINCPYNTKYEKYLKLNEIPIWFWRKKIKWSCSLLRIKHMLHVNSNCPILFLTVCIFEWNSIKWITRQRNVQKCNSNYFKMCMKKIFNRSSPKIQIVKKKSLSYSSVFIYVFLKGNGEIQKWYKYREYITMIQKYVHDGVYI